MKGDRGIILIIIIVLVVCVIAMGIVLSLTWRFVGEPIQNSLSEFGEVVKVQRLNYNFDIPEIEAGIVLPGDSTFDNEDKFQENIKDADQSYNFNFDLPQVEIAAADLDIQDAILEDARKAGYGTVAGEVGSTNMRVVVPKIGIDSAVWQGFGADDLLLKGFWIYPSANKLGKGEIVMLCHRRHFGPYDPRSCWYLDQVAVGDKVVMDLYDTQYEYKVIETKIYDANDPAIYQDVSQTKDRVRLVTCHPLYSNTQRFVVIAERV